VRPTPNSLNIIQRCAPRETSVYETLPEAFSIVCNRKLNQTFVFLHLRTRISDAATKLSHIVGHFRQDIPNKIVYPCEWMAKIIAA
jgi:hypothetical protein